MKKSLKELNSFVLSASIIGIFIVVILFLSSLGGFQWDLTKNKSFTLSDQTMTLLEELDEDISMKLFMSSAEEPLLTREVEDIAEEYSKQSRHLKYEKYDLYQEPSLAKTYDLSYTSIVFEKGDKKQVVGLYEMFDIGQSAGEYQFSGEEKMTRAIRNLLDDSKSKGYVLTGHDEIPLSYMSVFASSMQQENVELEELNLYEAGQIPADADLLLLLGAEQDIRDQELTLLKEYLQGDGKLYIAAGFNQEMADAWPNLSSLMSMLGVQYEAAIAVEPKESLMYDAFTIVPGYKDHEITTKLEEYQKLTLLSLVVPLKSQENEGYAVEPLLTSSEQAYGETDLESLVSGEGSERSEEDLEGPFDLGYAVTTHEGTPKAVIMGSVTYLLDEDIYTQGNRDFALNSVAWLQEKEDQVTIRPRHNEAYQLAYLTETQAKLIFTVTVVIFPLLLLLIGAILWWRRRRSG